MLLDRSSDMVFVIEVASGRLLDFNDPVLVQLGFTREELSERSRFKSVDPATLPAAGRSGLPEAHLAGEHRQ